MNLGQMLIEMTSQFGAYLLAAFATFTVVAYALGWIQWLDKEKVARNFWVRLLMSNSSPSLKRKTF
jgi:hypothetical protein